jgi:hypothetical protein
VRKVMHTWVEQLVGYALRVKDAALVVGSPVGYLMRWWAALLRRQRAVREHTELQMRGTRVLCSRRWPWPSGGPRANLGWTMYGATVRYVKKGRTFTITLAGEERT